jgi:exosortase/archaeosortase family protein
MPVSTSRRSLAMGLAWRILVYFGFVALSVPLLRGGDRLTHGHTLAAISASALELLGVPVSRRGDVISGAGFSMQVAPVCDGADLAVILGLAILLSPAPWRARIWGVVGALVATQLLNLGRLVCMFAVGAYLPQYFDLFHQVLWQAIAIMCCVAIYAAWLSRVTLPADGP